jgi:hypothetical protein
MTRAPTAAEAAGRRVAQRVAFRQVDFRGAVRDLVRVRAASFGRQQRLYFTPLPQGHGALRWIVACFRRLPPKIRLKTLRTI